MDKSSKLTPDFSGILPLLNEAPTKENGWSQDVKEQNLKAIPDSTICVYKKHNDSTPVVIIRMEVIFKGINRQKFAEQFMDIEGRQQWDVKCKSIKRVEKIADNSDIIYFVLNTPFPLDNRDFLQFRYFIGNKTHPEECKTHNLPTTDHEYFVMSTRSIERDDYPPQKGIVRAKTLNGGWRIEEIPGKPGYTKYTAIMQQDLGGNIPKFAINSQAGKQSISTVEGMAGHYIKKHGLEK